jgi:cysteine-rich repeat protein
MRMRTLGLAAALAAGLTQSSDAVVHQKSADDPVVSADRAPRAHRTVGWVQGGAKLAHAGLASWTAIWDRDTEVPLRLWGRGILVPGSVDDAAIAEAAARQFLSQHVALLAPGSTAGDFIVVANRLNGGGDTRSIGFQQRAQGVRVAGAAIGVTFKRDRIVMVGSTAIPHVAVTLPAKRLASSTIADSAAAWLAKDGWSVSATTAHQLVGAERVIIPIVRPRRGTTLDISFRLAEYVPLAAGDGIPGAWDVWVDAATAAPIMRKSRLHFATGKVLFDVPERYPLGSRRALAAGTATHTVNNAAVTATSDGSITWAGNAAASVRFGLRGPLIAITNTGAALATETMTLQPAGMVTWSRAAIERDDAQLTAYVHASIVKEFAKTRLDPGLAWLDDTLSVVVNEGSTCNAYSTGDDIHFYRRSNQCENTARLADVVYHEFGHSLHNHAIIEGVGQFDGALSEGMSDVLSALLTNDAGMGRGFFHSDEPMRDLNPATDKRWPEDATGQVHADGEIIGGTMWDLKVALETKLGAAAGHAKTVEIFYGVLQRASDIPSSYAEALVADDDDGDLANGTPNQCEINDAFKRHGLADGEVTGSIAPPVRDGFEVSIATPSGGSSACATPGIGSAIVEWRPRGGTGGEVALAAIDDRLVGEIPTQEPGTVVEYRVRVTLENGTTVEYPNNPADPYYQFYVGNVTPLTCFDFETGIGEWTHGGTADDWEAGEPRGLGNDPRSAFAGSGVLGTDLGMDGAYTRQTASFVESPEIDLAGHPDARLHLQRWLGIEDGFYDRARLLINGQEVWSNFASATEPQQNGTNHLDKEWRFQDLDLAQFAADGKVKLRFELETDEGLQFGGWTLDEICVVVPFAGTPPGCGDGEVAGFEQCDDGNTDGGDGCSATCEDELGGPGDEDPDGSGCCSASDTPHGALALCLLVLGIVLRRRR